jgi:hypothetical protein
MNHTFPVLHIQTTKVFCYLLLQKGERLNTSATNIPAANTSSAELCSSATEDMSLSNELQNQSVVSCSNFDFKDSKSV